jgi:uncharacterized membrane protein YbhN (UPF0104 family)
VKLRLAAVLLLTAVFLAGVLWDQDWERSAEALEKTHWFFLVPMFGAYLVAHSLRAWRLGILLDEGVSYRRLFSINTVGFLAINVLPLRLGEMVRPYLLSEREGVPFAKGLAAIFLERLLDMAMLMVLLLGLMSFVDLPDDGLLVVVGEGGIALNLEGALTWVQGGPVDGEVLPEGLDVIAAGQRFAGTILALGSLAGLGLVVIGEPAIALLRRLPKGDLLAAFASRFREGFVQLARNPARGLLLSAITGSIWMITLGAIYTVIAAFPDVGQAFTGGWEAFQGTWSVWTITLTGMSTIPTPGFVGVFEASCTIGLFLWGIDPDIGRTFALVLHGGQLSFIVVLGGIFMVVEGLSLRDLVQKRGENSDELPQSD